MPRFTLNRLLPLVVLVSLAAACGSSTDDDGGSGGSAADVRIKLGATTLGAGAFTPDTFTTSFATKQRVVWANNDRSGTYGSNSVTHHLVADDGTFDTGNLAGGKNVGITFAAAGVIPYHCTIHPTMVGVIELTP